MYPFTKQRSVFFFNEKEKEDSFHWISGWKWTLPMYKSTKVNASMVQDKSEINIAIIALISGPAKHGRGGGPVPYPNSYMYLLQGIT